MTGIIKKWTVDHTLAGDHPPPPPPSRPKVRLGLSRVWFGLYLEVRTLVPEKCKPVRATLVPSSVFFSFEKTLPVKLCPVTAVPIELAGYVTVDDVELHVLGCRLTC